MAILAYPVAQSTTSSLFGPKIGTSFGNSKPTGQSFNVITNVLWGIVLDQNKLNEPSAQTTSFVKLQIPLDTKKLSSIEVNSAWSQSNTAKLGTTVWYANAISFGNTIRDNQTVSINVSSWTSLSINFDNTTTDVMQTGNVYAGSLIDPYLYDSLTTGSMILVNNTTIGIPNASSTPTIDSYNEKMLTLNTGCVMAYGELQRNNGWTV